MSVRNPCNLQNSVHQCRLPDHMSNNCQAEVQIAHSKGSLQLSRIKLAVLVQIDSFKPLQAAQSDELKQPDRTKKYRLPARTPSD